MNFSAQINGYPVEARYSDACVEEILLPLLRDWTALRQRAGRRIIVFLAAPPAAGKSTLAEFLQALSRQTPGVLPLQAAGMDGFHRYQRDLETHTLIRDGREIRLSEIKGAPETFDLTGLRSRLERLRREPECPWPLYSRPLHNPVDPGVPLTGEIILLEGNYLLLDEPGWRELRELADDTVRILARPEDLRARLLERKLRSVPDMEKAAAFVDGSDLPNAERILARSLPARVTLRMTENGDYLREP